MSEQAQVSVVQQIIVPAYVWHDEQQRKAVLTHVGSSMADAGKRMRENIDVAQAKITPHGMKAGVASAVIRDGGEPVSFVAFDHTPLEAADLVVIVVDAPVVPS